MIIITIIIIIIIGRYQQHDGASEAEPIPGTAEWRRLAFGIASATLTQSSCESADNKSNYQKS